MKLSLRVILQLLVVLMPLCAKAQQEVDYMKYKFYKEEEHYDSKREEALWWLAEDVDSIKFHSAKADYHRITSTDYAMRRVEYSPRGAGRNEEQHLVGNLDVGYSTARLISALGIERSFGGSASHPITSGRSSVYDIFQYDAVNRRHRLYTEFSGRNYLGSLSFRTSYPIYKKVHLRHDWQLSHYIRVNTGRDLYIDGVSGNGFEIAAAAQRRWNNDALFIAAMLPWSRRSIRQYSVEEAFRLTDNHHYNPAWGMQNGRMRNSRQNSVLRPEAVASWWHRISAWTAMTITLRGAVEREGRRALAWFDAPTPMPDNYRYLPSYFSDDEQRIVTDAWRYNDLKYTQIDWDKLYKINSLQSDGHAVYAVENRRSNTILGDIAVQLTSRLRIFDIDYGATINVDSRREFKVVDDLLGADHLLNIDYFISDDATYSTQYRNNLRDNDLTIRNNDHYGYDYRLTRWNIGLFGVARWAYDGFNFEVGANLSYVDIRRRGYFEKELFSGGRSFGRSRSASFYPASLSALCTYHLGSHKLNASFIARGNAPEQESVFLQPEYNNRLAESLRTSLTIASELGYEYTHTNLKLSATLFLSHHSRERDVVRYYDDLAQEYVDAVISDISRLNFGFEAEASVRWLRHFRSQVALSVGRYSYCKDARIDIYADNDNDLIATTKSLMKGRHSSYPAISLYGDISYRRAGWQATASVQYWGFRYVSPSFIRRSERVLNYAPSVEEQEVLNSQQRLNDAVSLSISLGKSFRFKDNLWLSIYFSVDNLLNSKIIYGGYEQNRVRRISGGYYSSIEPFANKLSYAYGRVFRLSASFGF